MSAKSICFAVLAMALAFCIAMPLASAKGAQTDNARIGIFDMQKIIKDSKAGRDARSTFEKEMADRRSLLATREESFKKLQNELNNAKNLEFAEQRERELKMSKELKELKRLQADLEEEMKNVDQDLTYKVLKDVVKIVKDIGEREKFSVIFQREPNMVYINNAIDITPNVLERYDAQYKK